MRGAGPSFTYRSFDVSLARFTFSDAVKKIYIPIYGPFRFTNCVNKGETNYITNVFFYEEAKNPIFMMFDN